jgi:urea transport system ATP-binding protein
LAIGRVLVTEPKLLILDEPTEGIQPNVVRQIGDVILRLNRDDKITVLLVEQKLAFARRIAQHFCIIDKGHMVAEGSILTPKKTYNCRTKVIVLFFGCISAL